MKDFSIGAITTFRVSKAELIDIINKNFPDPCGSIAVITECETRDDDGTKIFNQSVLFGKVLKY